VVKLVLFTKPAAGVVIASLAATPKMSVTVCEAVISLGSAILAVRDLLPTEPVMTRLLKVAIPAEAETAVVPEIVAPVALRTTF
jgi:hypothetical protein